MKTTPTSTPSSYLGALNTPGSWKWTGRAVGAAILFSWLWAALHSEVWFLLAFLSTLVAAGWALRFRRDILISVLAVLLTAGIPALVMIHEFNSQLASALPVAAVLTGHIIAAPVPTLLAWTLRPTLISRAVNSMIGSMILLLGTVPVTVFGGRWGGAAPLTTALVIACAVVIHRHRRAWNRQIAGLPTVGGWTDMGERTVPGGSAQLFLRRGRVMTALTIHDEKIVQRVLIRAMQRSIDTATAIGIPAGRVQPVVIATHGSAPLGAHPVKTSQGQCTVLVAAPGQIPAQQTAPRRLGAHRRTLYAAAALPSESNQR